jgi:hypothetical protein
MFRSQFGGMPAKKYLGRPRPAGLGGDMENAQTVHKQKLKFIYRYARLSSGV